MASHAIGVVQRSAGRPEPLFLMIATEAPHAPAIPADRHSGEFRREGLLDVPSINEGDVRDKPAWVQNIPLLGPTELAAAHSRQQGRLRTMRAVEELIQRLLGALEQSGRLANTYIFFTSDNGLLMGEHRAVSRKNCAYEESIRVPLYVRGPGVPAGRALDHFVLNIDLAPTFLELAGAAPVEAMDGRSLVPLLRAGAPPSSAWRQDVLVEHFSIGVSSALRNADWMYQELESNEIELYDMKADPYQTNSLHRRADPALLASLSQRLRQLSACRGASCRS
jgi:arylsulfatase A-like enzyme